MVSFVCNAIYVEDVKDRSNTLRAVMLCMSKMLKMEKEHTHTFWLITSLILNGFFNPEKVLESSDLGLSNHTIKYCVY